MYIAGTDSLRDVSQWHLIPLGQIKRSDIYKRAVQYKEYYPEVDTYIGHSYGAVVAEHLQSEYGGTVRTKGAPYISSPFESHPERQSNLFDPVSFADFGASRSLPSNWMNPHGY